MTHERYIDHLVKLAAKNPCEGVVEEPRAMFDVIRVASKVQPSRSNAQVFQNGEQYPILLTHLTAFVRQDYQGGNTTGDDEALVQRIGARLVYSGTFYQNADFQALPLWHNVVSSGNPALGRSHASFTFDRPLILSSQNSFDVRVDYGVTPTSPRLCEVTMMGVGLLSQQPVVLGGSVEISAQGQLSLSPEAFRNLRMEPVALTDMTVLVTAEADDGTSVGDLRPLNIAIRSIGGGTQAEFFSGPVDPPWPRMPAYLLGKTTGRCLVHRFPGDGVRLEPGDSFFAELLALDDTAVGLDVALAAHGTIFVT